MGTSKNCAAGHEPRLTSQRAIESGQESTSHWGDCGGPDLQDSPAWRGDGLSLYRLGCEHVSFGPLRDVIHLPRHDERTTEAACIGNFLGLIIETVSVEMMHRQLLASGAGLHADDKSGWALRNVSRTAAHPFGTRQMSFAGELAT